MPWPGMVGAMPRRRPPGLPGVAADAADPATRKGGRLTSPRACSSACTMSLPSTWIASAGPKPLFRELGLRQGRLPFRAGVPWRLPERRRRRFRSLVPGADRPFAVEWHLHGYHHLESPAGRAQCKRRQAATATGWLQAPVHDGGGGGVPGPGSPSPTAAPVAGGPGFLPPLPGSGPGRLRGAGLAVQRLPAAPAPGLGIRYTEDHRRLYRTDTGGQPAQSGHHLGHAHLAAEIRIPGGLPACWPGFSPPLPTCGSPCIPSISIIPPRCRSIRSGVAARHAGAGAGFPSDLGLREPAGDSIGTQGSGRSTFRSLFG